jgi:hydrogenase maturation protein HypF
VGDYRGFRRVAHLEYLPMPGGEAAILQPWRLALGYAYALTGELPSLPGVGEQQLRVARQQIDRQLNTPLTSAAGRLFDAVAALIGIRQQVSYEAQAAIELEMLATRQQAAWRAGEAPPIYPFDVEPGEDSTVIRLKALIEAIQADLRTETSQAKVACKFHNTMAEMIVSVCRHAAEDTGLRTVALSGGCFQNRLLLELAVLGLERAGLNVLVHRQVPCNDGGISLGQAALAHFSLEE